MTQFYQDQDGDNFEVSDCTPLFAENDMPARAAITGDDTVIDLERCEVITVYQIFGIDYEGQPDAEDAIAEAFINMARETGGAELMETYRNDEVMMNEDFNNWTDALCKNGQICQDSYNELAPELSEVVQ